MKNKNINILVTGIGGDIGIGIVKILNELKYHKTLVGCDINEYPANKLDVDLFYVSPRADNRDQYLSFIKLICINHDISLIIPSSEIEIKVLNENKLYFGDKVKVLINHNKIINTFMDKLQTIDFLKKNGINHPKTYDIKEFSNQLNYPFLLKERFSRGSKGVVRIEDNDDFIYYKKKFPNSIIQEIVGDNEHEYTITIFSDGQNIYNIAFQRILGYGSLSKFVRRVSDPKIDDLAIRIANLINLKGSINVQVRKNADGEYLPFEINPRLSSTLAFRHYFGFKDLKWWVDLICYGSCLEITPKYFNGIGVKTVSEVYFDMEEPIDED
ncbi:ATP-grasp domain-containing protein [Soehngenia longivitae]|uniref:ATP-grasp domain-containing protein n=1 Tax=Soehngenia longivitae TaxID=2562294 RepID=A0A4Z0D7F1_9FIRM|nr:ATP-grasp domain-containing protein [Soehngenia longivitae]TFZ40797.1 ATP-grasp domain-containing protein [Soehngenia longivitae]